MELGNRIKQLRKEKGLSQENLADRLNISRQAVAKWEQNYCEPGIDNLVAMANVFGVDLDYLILGKEKNTEPKADKDSKTESNFHSASARRIILDKTDVTLIIIMAVCVLTVIVMLIFAALAPIKGWVENDGYMYYTQSALVWFHNGWFLTFFIAAIIAFFVSLIWFIKRR